MRLLLVHGTERALEVCRRGLQGSDLVIDGALSCEDALEMLRAFPYEVAVVDVDLPGGARAGIRLVKQMRRDGYRVPVLMASLRDSVPERVEALNAGADDWIAWPITIEELVARIRALARRPPLKLVPVEHWGPLEIDRAGRGARLDGKPVHLTAKEFGLLNLLSGSPGRVFSQDEIIDRLWDDRFDNDSKIVEAYVKNLRRKIGAWVVETSRGHGYRFPAEVHDLVRVEVEKQR
ncbi:MAG TPA: response regulator transcription factor [Deinococcales bacterium]|nr:response regulator transcription factor [Deinococcales bacterium]